MRGIFLNSTTNVCENEQPVEPVSIDIERPLLPPNKAFKEGGETPTNKKSQGMDVDIFGAMEEVNSEKDILETQDDSLSLSHRIKIKEPEHKSNPLDTRYETPSLYLLM